MQLEKLNRNDYAKLTSIINQKDLVKILNSVIVKGFNSFECSITKSRTKRVQDILENIFLRIINNSMSFFDLGAILKIMDINGMKDDEVYHNLNIIFLRCLKKLKMTYDNAVLNKIPPMEHFGLDSSDFSSPAFWGANPTAA